MRDTVKDYYGKTLNSSSDLQTDACCTIDAIPEYLKPLMAQIHDEVSARYYGCGLVAPEELEGMSILDLGSGSGQDCFILSKLVGEHGRVVGIDMTDEQLAVAKQYVDYHRDLYGYKQSNVSFHKGYLEQLDALPLEAESFDIVVSNCVINLCTDKLAVLKQIKRLLKPGGEMYFSDVYASKRVPQALVNDPVLYGECLSGALYWNDFLNMAKQAGFGDPRLVTDRPLTIDNPELKEKLAGIEFYSATYRLFNIDDLEPACEDYGQAVMYKGTIPYHSAALLLDKHHVIETGKVFPVCGNTYHMLHQTRLAKHFDFIGDFSTHFGIFEGCGMNIPFDSIQGAMLGACC